MHEAVRAFSAADSPICKRASEDQINLLQIQSVMEQDLGQPFVEMSLNETAYQVYNLFKPLLFQIYILKMNPSPDYKCGGKYYLLI